MAASSAQLPLRTHSNAFWSDPHSVPRLAVLLLNAPLAPHWQLRGPPSSSSSTDSATSELFRTLWNSAELRVCADGGANRLFDASNAARNSSDRDSDVLDPHCIKGDLDSLRSDVRTFYAARGVRVERDAGQDSNDLDKCLELLFARQEEPEAAPTRFTVVIFGALGGRLDQEMQNLNALFCWHDRFEQLVLLSEDATARLLLPGLRHVLEPNFAFETRTCGLLPLAGACATTTTSGLQWNLRGQEMRFGGLISSSNHVADDHTVVHVENSHPLIWTTELRK